jgi:hypothetical protein
MTVRGVDWAVVLGGSAIGAVILGCSVAFAEDDPPLQYFRLALVVLAATAAFVLDPGTSVSKTDMAHQNRCHFTT